MKNIVIAGSSGFAEEIAWLIKRKNDVFYEWNFLGYIGDGAGEQCLGDDQFLLHYSEPLSVVIAIGSPQIRHRLYHLYKQNKNLAFPNMIDPGVLMSSSVVLGEGNIICANTILTTEIELGNFNIINLGCTIGHETVLHDFITVNPSVNISGKVEIGSMANIGTGTQIIQGKSIGKNAVIGAGAAVVRDIPEACTAVGVPARIIKYGGKP